MAEANNQQEQQKGSKIKAWIKQKVNVAIEKIFTGVWNRPESLGGSQGKFTPPSWAPGGEQSIPVTREFSPYFEENTIKMENKNKRIFEAPVGQKGKFDLHNEYKCIIQERTKMFNLIRMKGGKK